MSGTFEHTSNFVCPLVLRQVLDVLDRAHKPNAGGYHAPNPGARFSSRYRSVTIQAPVRGPLEQLAATHSQRREGRELVSLPTQVMTIMFDLPTVVVARSASVLDTLDPMRRLPNGGLKLFRARLENSNGDRKDMSYGIPASISGPTGESVWGSGSRPAVITGGMFFQTGSSLTIHCTPRVQDIEVELTFWCLEQFGISSYGNDGLKGFN